MTSLFFIFAWMALTKSLTFLLYFLLLALSSLAQQPCNKQDTSRQGRIACARLFYSLGLDNLDRKDSMAALVSFRDACSYDPLFPDAWFQVAKIENAQGKVDTSIFIIIHAINALQPNPSVRSGLVLLGREIYEVQFNAGHRASEVNDYHNAYPALYKALMICQGVPDLNCGEEVVQDIKKLRRSQYFIMINEAESALQANRPLFAESILAETERYVIRYRHEIGQTDELDSLRNDISQAWMTSAAMQLQAGYSLKSLESLIKAIKANTALQNDTAAASLARDICRTVLGNIAEGGWAIDDAIEALENTIDVGIAWGFTHNEAMRRLRLDAAASFMSKRCQTMYSGYEKGNAKALNLATAHKFREAIEVVTEGLKQADIARPCGAIAKEGSILLKILMVAKEIEYRIDSSQACLMNDDLVGYLEQRCRIDSALASHPEIEGIAHIMASPELFCLNVDPELLKTLIMKLPGHHKPEYAIWALQAMEFRAIPSKKTKKQQISLAKYLNHLPPPMKALCIAMVPQTEYYKYFWKRVK